MGGLRSSELFQKSRIKSDRWPRIKSGRQGNTSSRGETGTIWFFAHRAEDPMNTPAGARGQESVAGPHRLAWTRAR